MTTATPSVPTRYALALAAMLCPSLASCAGEAQPMDLLVLGGTVVDGTGSPSRSADVGVREGRIVLVGDASGAEAVDTLDARGLVVAPGFVDAHNHSPPDLVEAERRWNEGFLRQGVTTVVGGPDGGMGPWDIRELVEAWEASPPGTNVALYVGHNAIRRRVMGDGPERRRTPSAEELEAMKGFVREGMDEGAVGFSTGLMYDPGMFSETGEVVALAAEAAARDGVYDSHVRNPVHALTESDREVVAVAERAEMPAKISHLKAVGLHNEGAIDQVVSLVEEARERGLEIVSDQYPYDGAATSDLVGIVVVPAEMEEELEGLRGRGEGDGRAPEAVAALERALRDPRRRAALKEASENGVEGGFAWLVATGYGSMRITSSDDYPDLVGRYLSEIAESRGQDPFDTVSELILGAGSPVWITLGAIKEEDVRTLMVQPWNMIASDGGWTDGSDRRQGHPRSAGTFPRFLGHYVRDEGLLSLEEGVRKITSLPADFHRLEGRGRVAEGYWADLAVFDPGRIADRSDWDHPQRHAEGVVHVVVNGVPALRDGALGERPAGRYLPRSGTAASEG